MRADIVLLDLGMSSMQIDTRARGFSYSYDAPLDMRMDPDLERSAARARQRGRAAPPRDDLPRPRRGALRPPDRPRDRPRARTRKPIASTCSSSTSSRRRSRRPARFAGGHPAKRVFQALRIAVNDELGQLDEALPLAWSILREHGRLAAISFHSLEDRRVKRFLAARAQGCICPPDLPVCGCGREPEAELVSRRSIAPTPGEIAANPRARSARLRVAAAEAWAEEDHG